MTILLGPATETNPARLLMERSRHVHQICSASHLRPALDPERRRDLIAEIVSALSQYEFDAIAFMGLSGSLVAPSVAMEMNKTLLAVRKKGENAHSWHLVEGDHAAKRYVILDDFSSSGETIKWIHRTIKLGLPEAQCLGLLEYLFLDKRFGHRLKYAVELEEWLANDVAKERARIALEQAREFNNVMVAPEVVWKYRYLLDGTVEKITS